MFPATEIANVMARRRIRRRAARELRRGAACTSRSPTAVTSPTTKGRSADALRESARPLGKAGRFNPAAIDDSALSDSDFEQAKTRLLESEAKRSESPARPVQQKAVTRPRDQVRSGFSYAIGVAVVVVIVVAALLLYQNASRPDTSTPAACENSGGTFFPSGGSGLLGGGTCVIGDEEYRVPPVQNLEP
jgi:hypothetical protein